MISQRLQVCSAAYGVHTLFLELSAVLSHNCVRYYNAGRFAKMVTTCDPSTLFATKAQIEQAVAILARKAIVTGQEPFASHPVKAAVGDADLENDAILWRARKLKEAAVHPDTGSIIPAPFRMSGYGSLRLLSHLNTPCHHTDLSVRSAVQRARMCPHGASHQHLGYCFGQLDKSVAKCVGQLLQSQCFLANHHGNACAVVLRCSRRVTGGKYSSFCALHQCQRDVRVHCTDRPILSRLNCSHVGTSRLDSAWPGKLYISVSVTSVCTVLTDPLCLV